MKPQAILINSARGPVVEEAALMQDIQHTQRLVVLDVFEYEPETSTCEHVVTTLVSQISRTPTASRALI